MYAILCRKREKRQQKKNFLCYFAPMMSSTTNDPYDLTLLKEIRHHNPHSFLGFHDTQDGQVIRLWRPKSEKIYLEVKGNVVEAVKVHEEGLFEFVTNHLSAKDYRIYHQSGLLAHDPYAFYPAIGEIDAFLFNKGVHYELYKVLGANIKEVQGVVGTQFAVWAPNASRVSLLGDCNHWKEHVHPMRKIGESGFWELFLPGMRKGMLYKYAIRTGYGHVFFKTDPYANQFELRPNTAAGVAGPH